MCNSACVDLLLGATTREVAPDTVFGVQSSKTVLEFKRVVTERQRSEAMVRAHERGFRAHREFVQSMGINRDLMDLIATVRFESLHLLTRDELYRFRIDTRDFAETGWMLETSPVPSIHKAAFAKIGGRLSKLEWQLSCAPNGRVRIVYAREVDAAAAGVSTVDMMAGPEKPPILGRLPVRIGSADVWSAVVAAVAMKNLFSVPVLEMGESRLSPDGTPSPHFFTVEIQTLGLEAASPKMSVLCATQPSGMPAITSLPAPPNSLPRSVFPTPMIPPRTVFPTPAIAPPR